MLEGKILLVTGGTGSFGNTLVKRALTGGIKEIRVFSRDEKKQEDMRHHYADDRLKFYIGDVRQYRSVLDAMGGVDLVFHAAALKQVPSCEFHPMEAVRTNVLGAENVVSAAIERRVGRVVVLSTDKAVYPINAMGISKAMMEKVAVAKGRNTPESQTCIAVTRYGNVMASRGSVIPLFIQQIKSGRPITVTDPKMTRFMMSLPQSVDLVLHAYANAHQGDIFVQKAPACTVGVLAEALCKVFGVEPDIRVIGTRHGEKLYESLISREEMVRADDTGGFYRVPADARDLNYANYVTQGDREISRAEDYTSHNAERLDVDGMVTLLLDLEYVQEELTSKTMVSQGE